MLRRGWLRGRAIGRGSTATVFHATDVASGEGFAVKSAELSRSALLQREQIFLSALSSPAIISCLGFDIASCDGGAVFYNLFLEYAHGGSLADYIKQHGRFVNEADVRSKTRDILAGLSYLHGRGIVHCDVKPGNVLLVSGGRAKVGDLGCARWVEEADRKAQGTPMYMAPEVARGEKQGMASDIWSLGCAVIEMVTGRPPWSEIVDALTTVRRIGFSADVPEIPAWVTKEARDFLEKCLRRDPSDRWSAEELLRHPFVADSGCPESSWISPKSTLDLSLWESIEEEEEEENEREGFCGQKPAEKIQDLAVFSGRPSWSWDSEWFEVRHADREFTKESVDASAGTSFSTTGDDGVVVCRRNADDVQRSGVGVDAVVVSEVGSVSCNFGYSGKAHSCKILSNYRFSKVNCYIWPSNSLPASKNNIIFEK